MRFRLGLDIGFGVWDRRSEVSASKIMKSFNQPETPDFRHFLAIPCARGFEAVSLWRGVCWRQAVQILSLRTPAEENYMLMVMLILTPPSPNSDPTPDGHRA